MAIKLVKADQQLRYTFFCEFLSNGDEEKNKILSDMKIVLLDGESCSNVNMKRHKCFFRLLQADTRDIEQYKREQEGVLKEIDKMVAARDSEFQLLNQKIEMLTER